jgi:hypothetical protein
MMVVHQGRHATVSVCLLLSGVATATSVRSRGAARQKLEGWFLTKVAWYVVFLRGNRVACSVGTAFKMGRLYTYMYVIRRMHASFLEDMDMKIDFKKDKIAKDNPRIWTMCEETSEDLARKYQDVKKHMLSKATSLEACKMLVNGSRI